MENLGAVVQRVRRQAVPDEFLTVVVKAGDGTGLVQQIAQRCAANPRGPEVRIMFGRAGDMTAAVREGSLMPPFCGRPSTPAAWTPRC